MKEERPFIVRFENQKDAFNFDVVVHHEDAIKANYWTRQYFGLMNIEYLHSDFNSNHTYRITPK